MVSGRCLFHAEHVTRTLADGRLESEFGRLVRNRRVFFFSSRRRHTRSVSAFLLNRSSDLFHKQMDNRIKLLEEILSFRMQGVEFDNGDMYVDGHKAASDVRDEFVSVTEKLMDELAQCYNVLPQLDINNTID